MGLLQRLGAAAASLVRGMGPLGLDDVGGALGSTGWFGPSGQPPRRGTPELLAAFKQSPVLRMVVQRIAESTASTCWRLYAVKDRSTGRAIRRRDVQAMSTPRTRSAALYTLRARGELEEITDHPLLDLLYDPMSTAPSSVHLTGFQVHMVSQAGLDLVGSVAWMLQRNAVGMPVEAWPIPDSWIVETPTRERPIYRVNIGSRTWEVPESEIVWFKVPDPANPYARGTGLGATLGDEVETFEYASKHLKTWFYNRAMPAGFIGVDGAKQSDLDAAKAKFENEQRGFWNAWRTYWHNGKLTWNPVQQTFEQQQMSSLRKDERDIVTHTFGFPPEILGILENANRATIDAADYLFASKVLVPRLELTRGVLQFRLAPMFDERLIVDYVSPVVENKEFQLKVVQTAPYAFRTNEIRRLADHDADPDSKHDVLPERPKNEKGNGAAAGGAVEGDEKKAPKSGDK